MADYVDTGDLDQLAADLDTATPPEICTWATDTWTNRRRPRPEISQVPPVPGEVRFGLRRGWEDARQYGNPFVQMPDASQAEDKTTGLTRARLVHARNRARQDRPEQPNSQSSRLSHAGRVEP